MAVRMVVLDCDGVILESVEIKTLAFGQLVAEHGPAAAARLLEYHRQNGGVSRYGKFEWFYREVLGREITEPESRSMGREFTRLCYEGVLGAPFVPGAYEFITGWSDRLPLYVASGTPQEELTEVLQARNLTRYFKGVYGTPPAKADLLARAVADAGLRPEEALMVGDSSTDLEAAEEVGTLFYGRGDGFRDSGWPWGDDLAGLGLWLEEHLGPVI